MKLEALFVCTSRGVPAMMSPRPSMMPGPITEEFVPVTLSNSDWLEYALLRFESDAGVDDDAFADDV